MADFSIIDPATNQRLNFTCENARFKTDLSQGLAHGQARARGSVYDDALLWSNAGRYGWNTSLRNRAVDRFSGSCGTTLTGSRRYR